MLGFIRTTKGLGNSEVYLRLRGVGTNIGKFYDFAGAAWVTPETSDCRILMTEYADSDTLESLYAANVTLPSGGPFVQEIARVTGGSVLGSNIAGSGALPTQTTLYTITITDDEGAIVPTTIDITIYQGTTFKRILVLQDIDGNAVDITDLTFRGQIRKTHKATAVAASFTFNKLAPYADGKAEMILPDEISDAITTGETADDEESQYVYDVEIEDLAGTVARPIMGAAIIDPQVTRTP